MSNNKDTRETGERHSRGLRRLRLLAVAVISSLLLAACTADGSSETTQADGGTTSAEATDTTPSAGSADEPLRIALSYTFSSINPVGSQKWGPPGFGYGELLMRQTASGQPEPWVLSSMEATSPTEWELTVNEGVTFHNGNPTDAEAVAALLNHQLGTDDRLASLLPGATAEATGPLTVVLTTTEPVSYAPSILAQDDMVAVYDVEALEQAGEDEQALIEAGIYTGPYKVVSLDDSQMVLERYEDYWQGTPALPGVELRFITDAQARMLAVQSGEIDIALRPPSEMAQQLADSDTAHWVTTEYATQGPRGLINLEESPVDDVLVRQAVSLALDYEAIANDVLDGLAEVAQGLYPMHLPFAIANQEYDPDAAAARLDEAGWVQSEDGTRIKNGQPLELTIVVTANDPDLETIAVAMVSQLEEVGIAAGIREIESSSTLFAGEVEDWHIALLTTAYFGYGNVIGIVHDYLTTTGGLNQFGIADEEIDAIAEQLDQTFEKEEQYELLRRLQEIVIDEQAYTIVLAERPEARAVSDEWANYEPSLVYINVDWQTAP